MMYLGMTITDIFDNSIYDPLRRVITWIVGIISKIFGFEIVDLVKYVSAPQHILNGNDWE